MSAEDNNDKLQKEFRNIFSFADSNEREEVQPSISARKKCFAKRKHRKTETSSDGIPLSVGHIPLPASEGPTTSQQMDYSYGGCLFRNVSKRNRTEELCNELDEANEGLKYEKRMRMETERQLTDCKKKLQEATADLKTKHLELLTAELVCQQNVSEALDTYRKMANENQAAARRHFESQLQNITGKYHAAIKETEKYKRKWETCTAAVRVNENVEKMRIDCLKILSRLDEIPAAVQQEAAAKKCKICLLDFAEEGGHVPRVLRCGHTICESCCLKCKKLNSVICPFCRDSTACGQNVQNIPKNFDLLD